MTPHIFKTLAFASLSSFSLHAQTKQDEEIAPLRTVTVIPVGRISDTYWIGEGANTKAVAVDPGATPPPRMFYKNSKGKFEALNLLLNSNSTAVQINSPSLEIYQQAPSEKGDKPTPFVNASIPTALGHYDVILWRSANKDDWEDAKHLVVPSSLAAYPKNSIRLLNINPKPIRVQLGSEAQDIPANSARIIRIAQKDLGKSLKSKIAYVDGKTWKFVFRSAVKIKDGERINIIIYPSRVKGRLCEITKFYQHEPLVAKEEKKQ